ncbi:transmembrane protein 143 [Patagioenas fasciata]|uniref:transmembrane protein 143 n=1 Tax=Patagioenas fasciata TaxID=372321 RepID=UPI003A9A1F04
MSAAGGRMLRAALTSPAPPRVTSVTPLTPLTPLTPMAPVAKVASMAKVAKGTSVTPMASVAKGTPVAPVAPVAKVTPVAKVAALVARGRGRRPPQLPPGWDFRDTFVPVTRQQLQHLLLTEFHPSGRSRAEFLAFAARLDQELSPRFHRIHLHLQALYGPIDPDRDTGEPPGGALGWGSPGGGGGGVSGGSPGVSGSGGVSGGSPGGSPGGSGPGGPGGVPGGAGGPGGVPGGRGRARRVLAALGPLLAEANFQRLPEAAMAFALRVQHPGDRLEVSVDPNEYEELQLWARGERIGPLPPDTAPDTAPPPRWKYRPRPQPQPDRHYFQRVVVLALPRGPPGGPLELGSFRAVPLDALELLLGRARARTPKGTRARLHVGLALWGALLFLNMGLGLMADLKVGASALLLGLAAAVALRGAKAFSRRRALAALELSRSRFRRSSAQHGDLVAALTRRAQDEATKEALLAGTFLPRCGGSALPPAEAERLLQAEVESWLRRRFRLNLNFNARRAQQRLRELGVPGGVPKTPDPPQ